MLTETDRRRYQIAINGLRDQRRILHIKKAKLSKSFFAEVERIEKGLVKSAEMEKDLRAEMEQVTNLPF